MKFSRGASGYLRLKQGEFLEGNVVAGVEGHRKPEGEPAFTGYRLSGMVGRLERGDWVAVEAVKPKLLGEIPKGAEDKKGAIIFDLRIGSSYYISDESIGLIASLPHDRKKALK